jgi:hypothetical protein
LIKHYFEGNLGTRSGFIDSQSGGKEDEWNNAQFLR